MRIVSSLISNCLALPKIIWQNRTLLWMLSRRNVESRYKGSALGLIWSFVQPLLMMCVYTFVFGLVFKARWPGEIGKNPLAFPVLMLCGMSVYTVFSESVSLNCGTIVGNPNYVKKVVFPLEILPTAQVFASFLLGLAWFGLLFFGSVLILRRVTASILFFPIVLLPLLFFSLGVSFFVSSMSVYARDTPHLTAVVLQVFFFMTPIFYSMQTLPPAAARVLSANPLAYVVEAVRDVFVYSQIPNWSQFGMVMIESLVVLLVGFLWFEKTKKGFADVI